MFTFRVVKRIGEGDYLNDDLFIIERVRRERALNMHQMKSKTNKFDIKGFLKNDRFKLS